ncbi:MAG: HAMP domain-containing sensor histidine kinase [Bacillota bacterium]|nr:HAMP domain-containing sensor histidine kinase [Bacillota bacterium]
MKKGKNYGPVKESRFPSSLFVIFFVILLLMSGIHTGLIVLVNRLECHAVVQCIIPMIYWGMVAAALTLFTRRKIRSAYEEPMHKLAEATSRVANGDFSVYVPAFHTQDKRDYLDVMIMDFNKMVEELGSIETLKTDFVSNVSHEMKTPIAIVKNYAELLKAEHITEEQRKEYAESIEGAAMRLSNLISNILKLNKLENQRIIPEVEAYDVCRQLCDCILQFEETWDEKEIELETEIDDVAMVEADESLLELVWNNLLSNAVKFTEHGGTVSVKQTSEESFVKISVSDTGSGMDTDVMNHIFDKFYQGDTSHSKEGNGLGLALVKRVLELMDGDIQVFSKPGKGSTFLVTLPAAGASENKDGGKQ